MLKTSDHYKYNTTMKYIIIILTIFSTLSIQAAVLYVNGELPPHSEDGKSWSTAFSTIQNALDIATPSDEIWVAKGLYIGGFKSKEGVSVYGGFSGVESLISERNITANETVLSGENRYRVIEQLSVYTTETIWDGFTVTKGSSVGAVSPSGAGVFISGGGLLRNCKVTLNVAPDKGNGGGVYINRGAWLDKCEISHNKAGGNGGGIAIGYGGRLTDCTISDNTTTKQGGGIYVNEGELIGCKIYDNTATAEGAGVYLLTTAKVDKCEVYGNTSATLGGGIYAIKGEVTNSSIYRNSAKKQGGGIASVPPAKYSNKTNYMQKATQYEVLPKHTTDILIAGDDFVNVAEWRELLADVRAKNRGINAETADLLEERISVLTSGTPAQIALYIGIRDLLRGDSPAKIASIVDAIVVKIKQHSPQTKIALMSLLPVSNEFSLGAGYTGKQASIIALNDLYKAIAKERSIGYIDLYTQMKKPDADWIQPSYTMDGFNLSGLGYVTMSTIMKKVLIP